MFEGILFALIGLMILGALVSLETKNLLASVISLGIVGFALTVLFVLLGAPDLAIVQIIVETLTLVIFISVIRQTTAQESPEKLMSFKKFSLLFGIFLLGILFCASLAQYQDLPPFGFPCLRMALYYLSHGMAVTGASNLVSAIILDFRGYDTLGEATVLFASAIGVATVLRKVRRNSS